MSIKQSMAGVLGFGTMGVGIGVCIAQQGSEVLVADESDERLAAGMERAAALLDTAEAGGQLGGATASEVLARLRPVKDVADFRSCEIVIEAIVEDLDAKLVALAAVSNVVALDTLIATNTSALSVTRLARAVDRPGRFAGLHFFNPAERMRLVEVVKGLQTSAETTERLVQFAESLGKEPVVAKDRPGFLLNRLLLPYLNQVIQDFDDGIATAKDIDLAVELGLGYPMGPLKLLDLIGLDTHLQATSAAYEETRDPHFAPPPLLARMVDAGYLGSKAGAGLADKEAQA